MENAGPSRSKQIIDRAKKTQGADISNEFWKKSLADVDAGWLGKPVPTDSINSEKTELTHRYGIP